MRYILAIIATVIFTNNSFAADTYQLVLAEGKISATELNVKIGDKIKIIHNDTTDAVHKLYATDKDHEFDLSLLAHGDHYDFDIVKAGTFNIHCHAMKDMVITINATE